MNTFKLGDLHRKQVLENIKTKLCSKAEEMGIVIEIAQRRSSSHIAWHPSEFWSNEKEQLIEFGDDKNSFFFTKEKLLFMAKALDIKVRNNIAYIHLDFNQALRYCAVYIDRTKSFKDEVQALMERTAKVIEERE
jgi:hypothetical protein